MIEKFKQSRKKTAWVRSLTCRDSRERVQEVPVHA